MADPRWLPKALRRNCEAGGMGKGIANWLLHRETRLQKQVAVVAVKSDRLVHWALNMEEDGDGCPYFRLALDLQCGLVSAYDSMNYRESEAAASRVFRGIKRVEAPLPHVWSHAGPSVADEQRNATFGLTSANA